LAAREEIAYAPELRHQPGDEVSSGSNTRTTCKMCD
jgi:hypothetical protein